MAQQVRNFLQWLCALVVGAWITLFSQPASAQTLQSQLLDDARDGELDRFDFISAALIASGVEELSELDAWRQAYATVQDQIAFEDLERLASQERLVALHRALHEKVLTGSYQREASDVRSALWGGNFNCLSATAIYLDLCEAAGEPVEIWLLPGHVCLRAENLDRGFLEPGAATWRVFSERDRDCKGRQLTTVELIGKFYYNRGVQLLERQQFAAGVGFLEMSLGFDPTDKDARENLVAGLNNWAVKEYRLRRYDRAAELIERGLQVAPDFAPLIANERLVGTTLGRNR